MIEKLEQMEVVPIRNARGDIIGEQVPNIGEKMQSLIVVMNCLIDVINVHSDMINNLTRSIDELAEVVAYDEGKSDD